MRKIVKQEKAAQAISSDQSEDSGGSPATVKDEELEIQIQDVGEAESNQIDEDSEVSYEPSDASGRADSMPLMSPTPSSATPQVCTTGATTSAELVAPPVLRGTPYIPPPVPPLYYLPAPPLVAYIPHPPYQITLYPIYFPPPTL
jgi:hypothetical protein